MPVGSLQFLARDHLQTLMEQFVKEATEQVKLEGKPEDTDLSRHIKDWAAKYGFSFQQVQEEIQKWAADIKKNEDDIYKLGLAAFAEKQFGKAADLFTESAQTKAKRLQALTQETEKLTEETVRDFRLAGDAAYNNYDFYRALVAYQSALEYLPREQSPNLWAQVLVETGKANTQIGIRTEGPAIHHHLNEAVTAYRQAHEVYTRDQLPHKWAAMQRILGIILRRQGTRTVGTEGLLLLAQAVAAYHQALEVYTRDQLPQEWAMAQNKLAKAAFLLEDWSMAAKSFANVLLIYPHFAEAFIYLNVIYHEKMFLFDKVFEINRQWLAGHPDDLAGQSNFVEAHFTTGRFAEAEKRFADLLANTELDPHSQIALRVIEIAMFLAQNMSKVVPSKLETLRATIAAQSEDFTLEWSFAGTKRFIGQDERLTPFRTWLISLIEGLGRKGPTFVAHRCRFGPVQFC